jgi:uncharacterized protein involved in oxidation of intracellular sulfur
MQREAFAAYKKNAMKILIVINDPPYGSERSYNALRLTNQLVTRDAMELSVFLMADTVLCAKAGQQTPQGYYNIERMLKPIVRKGEVILCSTCMDARGIKDDEIVDGARRGTMVELTDLTLQAEKVIVF